MARILIAEDNASIRNVYAFAFEAEGFEVAAAESGAQALAWVKDRHFDVILLDLLMMEMSGLDFLRAYDVRKESPSTKVVALTNFTEDDITQRATELGVMACLDKSAYDPSQIVQYVKDVLAGKIVATG